MGIQAQHVGRFCQMVLPELHFHDLRHAGNNIAVDSRASLRDLMGRMGHDSVRAAMSYLAVIDNGPPIARTPPSLIETGAFSLVGTTGFEPVTPRL